MKKLVSPCVNVCHISPGNDFCKGCFRTRDEISRWRGLDYYEQKKIISELKKRRSNSKGSSSRRPSDLKK